MLNPNATASAVAGGLVDAEQLRAGIDEFG
jgi:hypothetical protein